MTEVRDYCDRPCIDWQEIGQCWCTRHGLDWDEVLEEDDDEAIDMEPILPPYEELFPE